MTTKFKFRVEDRVMDEQGHTGSLKEIRGEEGKVLWDSQRPSSEPKLIALKELRYVSG